MRKLVAEELGKGMLSLPNYEKYFGEGDTGELRLYLEESLSEELIYQMGQEILGQGVVLTEPIVQDARILRIKFQKTIASLVAIKATVEDVDVIGWQLFREGTDVSIWVWVASGIITACLLLRKSVRRR